MNSVEAGITYTGFCGHGPYPCCCGTVPRTLWSLLCNQLFDLVTNPMMGPEGTFDEVQIWSEGEITMTVTSSPYTFVMVLPDEAVPKASDIIYYGRRFFIIGAVELTGENTYTCTGCLSIDVSIVGVYAALINLQQQVSASEAERQDAEAERSREFDEDQAEREAAFDLSQQTMQEEFDADQAARTQQIEETTAAFLAPWVVPGTLASSNRLFTPTSGSDSASTARTRFYQGKKTFLSVQELGTEEVIADDGFRLLTRSGWKWQYPN